MELTHINKQGRAKMVDVGSKVDTEREAIAYGYVNMKRETLNKIKERYHIKGRRTICSPSSRYYGSKKYS